MTDAETKLVEDLIQWWKDRKASKSPTDNILITVKQMNALESLLRDAKRWA